MQTAPSLNIDPVSLRADAALTGYHDGACSVCPHEIAVYRWQPGVEQWLRVDACSGLGSALGIGLSRNGLPRPLAAGTAATSARAAHGIGFEGATKTSALDSNSVAVMGAHCAGPSVLADPPAGLWPVGPESPRVLSVGSIVSRWSPPVRRYGIKTLAPLFVQQPLN